MLEIGKLRQDMAAQQRRLDKDKARSDRMFKIEVWKAVAVVLGSIIATAAFLTSLVR